MTLPSLRLAHLRSFGCLPDVAPVLRELLLGRILLLPAVLSDEEHGEIADAIALFLDLPVHVTSELAGAHPRTISVIQGPVDPTQRLLPGLEETVILALAAPVSGQRPLDMPPEVSVLRDALLECLGRHYSGTRMQRVVAWASAASDSPGTLLRFFDGVLTRQTREPEATDDVLRVAGVARTVAWLLRGVDPRAVQWTLAHALRVPDPGQFVDADAAMLGEQAALRRAFSAGLVELLPTDPGDPLDLRRPFSALATLHSESRLTTLIEALEPELMPRDLDVLRRAARARPEPLGRLGPTLVEPFVGRDEVVQRLIALVEPAREILITVLVGLGGTGKTQVAAAVSRMLAHRLEPIWLDFRSSPLAAWHDVATALGLVIWHDTARTGGVPHWVHQAHDLLRSRPCLLVLESAEFVDEQTLGEWIPRGRGVMSVLVLSRRSERTLQRSHDAVAVTLPSLSTTAAHQLLRDLAPGTTQEIAKGVLDPLIHALDGHPLALRLLASELRSSPASEIMARHGRDLGSFDPQRSVGVLLGQVLDELGDERRLLDAMAVCAPGETDQRLPLMMTSLGVAAFEEVARRGFVAIENNSIHLHELSRLALLRKLDHEQRRALERKHAATVNALLKESPESDSRQLYDDLALAVERLCEPATPDERPDASLLLNLTRWLAKFFHRPGSRYKHLQLVMVGYRRASALFDRINEPLEWATARVELGKTIYNAKALDHSTGVDMDEALQTLTEALTALSREQSPRLWAGAKVALGDVLGTLQDQGRQGTPHFMEPYLEALQVFTREEAPEDWAHIYLNIAINTPTGAKSIEYVQTALQVLSPDSTPREWARAQRLLSIKCRNWIMANPAEEHKLYNMALNAANVSLTVYTKELNPYQWAHGLRVLGNILSRGPAPIPAEDLPMWTRPEEDWRTAFESYQQALTVLTREDFPFQWGAIHWHLGQLHERRATGDRGENLQRAASAYQAAMDVDSPEQSLARERYKYIIKRLLLQSTPQSP